MKTKLELYFEKQIKLNIEYQSFVNKIVKSCCDISKDYNNLSFENKCKVQQELPLILLTTICEINKCAN